MLPYTLWSKNRLLGHSTLGYVEVFPKHRMGSFHPTALGEQLMPTITGVGRATRQLSRSVVERAGHALAPISEAELYRSSEYADIAAARAHFDALELVLRAPDGSVVPTEWIDIRDTEEIIAWAESVGAAREWDVDFDPDDFDPGDIDPILATEEQRDLIRSLEHDSALLEAMAREPEDQVREDEPGGTSDTEGFPRYQIQVGLQGASDADPPAL